MTNTTPVVPGTTRWAELVRMGQGVVSNRNWQLGDAALEIFPVGLGHGGDRSKPDSGPTCEELLAQYADEVGVSLATIQKCRYTSNAWPVEKRTFETSWKVYQLLLGNQQHIKDGMTTTEASLALGQSNPGRIQSERDKDIAEAVAAAKAEAEAVAAANAERAAAAAEVAAAKAVEAAAAAAKRLAEQAAAKAAAEVKAAADAERAAAVAAAKAEEQAKAAALREEVKAVVEASKAETEAAAAEAARVIAAQQAEILRKEAEAKGAKRAKANARVQFPKFATSGYTIGADELRIGMDLDRVHRDQAVAYKAAYEAAFSEVWDELVADRARVEAERASLAKQAVVTGIENAIAYLEANAASLTTAQRDRLIEVVAPVST